MPITLEALRTFAAETASTDPSSMSSDREIHSWINSALEEVWLALDWHWARSLTRLTMVPSESGSYLGATLGSRDLTLDTAQAEVFDEKYLAEGWLLLVDAEGRMGFELDRIDDAHTARLQDGHLWIQATATGLGYTWTRTTYPLPGGAIKIHRVEDLQAYGDIQYRHPASFDYERSHAPTQRGNRPYMYTVRAGNIELWPGPSTAYLPLSVTYKRPAPQFDESEPGDLEVDWPTDKLGLIQKAIICQASLTQGKNAPVPYDRAIYAYNTLLDRHRASDTDVAELAGPMSLGGGPHGRIDFSRLSGITDNMS